MSTLTLRAPGYPAIELALTEGAGTERAANISGIRRTVCSDVRWTFELPLSAFSPLAETESALNVNATYQLFINETFVPTRAEIRNALLILTPSDPLSSDDPIPFRDYIGTAAVEIRRLARGFPTQTLLSETVLIAIRQGPTAEAVRSMAKRVLAGLKHYGQNTQGEGDTGALKLEAVLFDTEARNDFAARLKILEDILKTYSQQAAYFRANARFHLVTGERIDGAGRLNGFSESALRYVIEHPDELVPSQSGRGIRVHNRTYVPERMLIQTTRKSFDLLENRIVLGFLKRLEEALSEEVATLELQCKRLPALLSTVEGYVCSAEALLGEVTERLTHYISHLRQYLTELRGLFLVYSRIFPITPACVTHIPAPTEIFISVPAYRLIYDNMVRWFGLGSLSFAREEFLMTCFERSRLYELFCLVAQLDALSCAGATFCGASHHAWHRPDGRTSDDTIPNVFRFTLPAGPHTPATTLTLFHEPVIKSPVLESEADMTLVRTSPLSWSAEGDFRMLDPRFAFYTPDFVLKVEQEGQGARWFIADAKYSVDTKVIEQQTKEILFKYLFSISPSEQGERIEGVWLFYPWLTKLGEAIQSATPWAPQSTAGLYFQHVSPATAAESGFIAAALGASAPH